MEAHRGMLPPMDYRRPREGPSMAPPPGHGRPPPSMAPPGHGYGRPPPSAPSAAPPPSRPIPPSSVPSLSSGQGFYTVESLQNATVVPPAQLLPPPRLLPPPEPFPLPERRLDRFDPPPPRPRSHFPDDRPFAPPPMPHPSRLDRGRPPLDREFPPHRDLPLRNVGPLVRGGPRMRQPPPSFSMDPRMTAFHPGRDSRGRGWGPSRDFGLGRRMDRARPMQSLGVRKQIQKTRSIPRAKSSLPAATAEKKSPVENQEEVEGGPGWCSVCQINCFRAETLNKHLAGKRHKRQLEKLNGEPGEANEEVEEAHCEPEEPNKEGEEANKEGEEVNKEGEEVHCEPEEANNDVEEAHDEPEELKKLDGEDQVMKEKEDTIDVDEVAKTAVNIESVEAPNEGKEIEHVEAVVTVKVAAPGAGKKRVIRDKDGGVATKKRQKAAVSSDVQNATVAAAGENEVKEVGNEKSRKVEKVADAAEVCQLCNVTCTSKAILEAHLKGKKHAARLKKAASIPDPKGVVVEGTGVTAAGDLANGIAGQSA